MKPHQSQKQVSIPSFEITYFFVDPKCWVVILCVILSVMLYVLLNLLAKWNDSFYAV